MDVKPAGPGGEERKPAWGAPSIAPPAASVQLAGTSLLAQWSKVFCSMRNYFLLLSFDTFPSVRKYNGSK